MTNMSTLTLVLVVLACVGHLSAQDANCTGALDCPNQGLCDPNNNTCVQNDPEVFCGSYGSYLVCADNGIVTSECGSGSKADCSNEQGCGGSTFESISCNYPELAPPYGYVATNWRCGGFGERLSCKDQYGSVLMGVCGSGSKEDCKGVCNGAHAILCAKSAYFNINWDDCTWVSASYGQEATCPPGFVGAGHCGSGKHSDCGPNVWHELQCCPFTYDDN